MWRRESRGCIRRRRVRTAAGAAGAAILFAPVGDLVPVALAALDQGGTLAIAGIHLTDVPGLEYNSTCCASGL